ncbi:hypothetical protein [uncultured Draconibacterium sp.]|uniref:hypothetical protein n=1 Tax=uncultured Draconibacterium sp. TaxID=1573823 RepID=UPI0025D0B884|nr:hypothetical protein [uncultured Draconibacterium sp.]
MKIYLTLLLGTTLVYALAAQNNKTLFFDDFEETISYDATFQKWTTENLEGWQYWHLVSWGYNSGQSMRFENNDLAQDDWLITHEITGEDITNALITFDVYHSGQGTKPILLYTNGYNGNAGQSSWTEIDYSLGDENDAWFNCSVLLEDPGDTLYFAFRSQVAANAGMLFLLDNFRVTDYTPPAPFNFVDSSDHFEYYTNIEGEKDYALAIKDDLEKQFDKLSSLWNRPGIEPVFQSGSLIKIYFSIRDDISMTEQNTPTWKCGFHNNSVKEIYLAPLENQLQSNFYGNFNKLAVNEFSQLAISCKFLRENNNYFPPYFLEGFGLYESGFRPNRDDVIQYVTDGLAYDYITDTSDIANNTIKKSLIIANIEGQVLTPWSYLNVNPGASSFISSQWQNFLKHFYTKPEPDRLKLQYSSEHFDFYSANSDSAHMTEAYSYFEDACSYYMENYGLQPEHRYNVVFCPDDQIGGDLTGWGPLSGGAGCGGDLVIEVSPNFNYNQSNFYSDYFGYTGMCAHEFFHIYYNHFMWSIPGGFWAEGTADFNQRHSLNWPIPQHSLWKINELFGAYKQNHNATINLEHIYTNPYNELDIYFLGDMFFEFVYQEYGGFENIMKFFNEEMDYSVFGVSYEEIDNGYINFLKSLAGITDVEQITEPRTEVFIESNKLCIQNAEQMQNAKLELFNTSGQKLLQTRINIISNGNFSLPLPGSVKSQFIIVRLQTKTDVISKKLFNPIY